MARVSLSTVANPFAVPWVGAGYAAARPDVHERFVEAALREMGSPPPFARALDVGCGTGLSARALGRAARRVVAIDPSLPMLRHAASGGGPACVAARAEALPALEAAFDVASVSSAFHWCDRERLLGELARVIRPGGWLLIYDSDLRGWSDGSREPVERLLADYWSRLPPCPRNPYFDPASHESEAFALHATALVTQPVSLSADQLAALIFTQASTVMAIVGGHARSEELRARLDRCLSGLFAGSSRRDLLFGGPLYVLRRPGEAPPGSRSRSGGIASSR